MAKKIKCTAFKTYIKVLRLWSLLLVGAMGFICMLSGCQKQVRDPDNKPQPKYGVMPAPIPDFGLEYGVEPDYIIDQPMYGVMPVPIDQPQPEYGVIRDPVDQPPQIKTNDLK